MDKLQKKIKLSYLYLQPMKFHRAIIASGVLSLWISTLLIVSGLFTIFFIFLQATSAAATNLPAPAQDVLTQTSPPPAEPAVLYVSNEEASSRALVDTQDDLWRAAVQSTQSCTNFQTSVLSETLSTLCGTETGACIKPTLFATGLTISYTLRNMTAGQLLGSADSWGSGRGAGCTSSSTTLQDGAPRPTGLTGCYYNDAANFRGDNNSPNAVLFTFNPPLNAFGAWFGDLETKPPGTTYYREGRDGGTGSGGALAYVRLVFADGTIQETPILPTLAPISTWLSPTAPALGLVGSDGNVGFCGGNDSSDPKGCGNETTRWIGFVTANPRHPVKQMLVTVGEDDHSGSGPSNGPNVQCSGGAATTCNAGTEYLSFIGPTVCLLPDLTISKFARPDPVVAGNIVTYTLRYQHVLANIASDVITLTDFLPLGVSYLATVAANPLATLLTPQPQWRIAGLPANATGYLTFTAQIDPQVTGVITNSVMLTASGELNLSNNQAQQRTLVLRPELTLRKWTNGVNADNPPGPTLQQGEPVTWRYHLTNTGAITLTQLQLIDDRIPNLVCAEGPLPAQLPPTAAFICTVSGTAQAGQYVNQATATATPMPGGKAISATARSHYFGLALGQVVVTKAVVTDHGGTARVADFPLALNGALITSGVTLTLPAGVYTVTESNALGYLASFRGDCDANGVINLAPGALQHCTLINNDPPPTLGVLQVQKRVINNDGGPAQISDFPLWVNQQAVQPGVDNLLAPGVYTISESNLPGYQAAFSGDCTATGALTLAAGEQKTCILTNDDIAPTLTVHKVVINDHGGQATVGDFTLRVGEMTVTSGVTVTLPVGHYAVSEESLPGYAATFSGDCAVDGTLTLQLGERKQCTLTNDDLPPRLATLTIHKRVVNDHGGAAQVADFPLFVSGQPVQSGVDQLLAPGSYHITETQAAGYAATFSGDCAADGTISLSAGESKVCRLTNDDIAPTLIVEKVVRNDHQGTASAADFPLWINANPVSNGAVNVLAAGVYTVSESNRAGYVATFSGDCSAAGSVALQIGETKRCTLTNDDLPPTLGSLTVQKIVINDHGGSATAADFALMVNGQPVVNGAANGLAPGVYTVSEVNQPGYAATFDGDCSGVGQVVLAAGEDKRCLIINNDLAPTLTLHKQVRNNHGGLASALDFPLFVDNRRVASGSPITLAAGSYRVQENDLLGYVGQIGGDCAPDGRIELRLGEVKQCTFTNTDLPPDRGLLLVRKQVINDHGGQAQISDFPLAVNGQPVVSGVETTFPPGAYTVRESNLPGYRAAFGGACAPDGTVLVSAHQTQVCIISNDDIAPTLTVEKVVFNDDGGTATVTDFPLLVDQQVVRSGVTTTLAAGDYTISERSLPGYQATFSGDCAANGQVTLALGERKRCVVTNNDHFASLGDRVWYDHNLDGQQAEDEPGISGLTVHLYDPAGNLISTTVTGPAGEYLFGGLLPGDYVVAFHKGADFVFTAPAQGSAQTDSDVNPDSGRTGVITLGASEHRRDLDAGLYQLAALGNFVWHDLNGNGVQEAHEPGLGQIWITLYDATQTVVGITRSNAQGYYGFSDLPPGAYTLKFELPPAYRFTAANQGDDGIDSDVDPSSGATAVVVLGPNDINLTAKAGVLAYPLLTLTKTVSQPRLAITATAAALLTYTLTYSNVGPAPATGVVITETVPLSTAFVAAASTPGWQCPAGSHAGATCWFSVGTIPPLGQGQVIFAVIPAPGLAGKLMLRNQARLGDDGANTARGMPRPVVEASVETEIHTPTSLAEGTEPVPLYGVRLYLPWVAGGR